MYDELITDSDNFDGYSVFDSSPDRLDSSSAAEVSAEPNELSSLSGEESKTE